jgi:hypothetical protein
VRKVNLIVCVLIVLAVTGCRPAATPVALPTPTAIGPVVGTALPGQSGALPVPPPLATTTAPVVTRAPSPTAELIPTGSSGIRLAVTIGPTCPGSERPGQVCTQPYEGLFVVTDPAGGEVARVTTDQNGQALIDLPPGEYMVTPKIEGRLPLGAPVSATVIDGQYVEVNIELDSGIR